MRLSILVVLLSSALSPLSGLASTSDCLSDVILSTPEEMGATVFFSALGTVSSSPGQCSVVREIAVQATRSSDGSDHCADGNKIWNNAGAHMKPETREMMARHFSGCTDLETKIRLAHPASSTGSKVPPPLKGNSQPPVIVPAGASHTAAGDWFVFAGTVPHASRESADRLAAALGKAGLSVEIIDTDNYDNLTNGLYAVVVRAASEDDAKLKMAEVRRHVSDAYIKKGG